MEVKLTTMDKDEIALFPAPHITDAFMLLEVTEYSLDRKRANLAAIYMSREDVDRLIAALQRFAGGGKDELEKAK